MANSYTTANLLTNIQLKGNIAASQTAFSNTNLLLLADDELSTDVLQTILSVRENFYLAYTDYSPNTDGLYDIPSRAIGSALADVQIISGQTIFPVTRSELSEQYNTQTSPSGDYSFVLKGNKVQVKTNPTFGTVRLYFYCRPNKLIQTSSALKITGIASNVLSFSSVDTSTFTTSTPLDVIQDQPHFNWLSMDNTPTGVTGTTITFAAAIEEVAVGDWVCLAGQTPVPQIPVEFRPYLEQRTVVKYYEAQGYLDKMNAASQRAEEIKNQVIDLINPRVSEKTKRIIGDSSLLGGISRRWRSWQTS